MSTCESKGAAQYDITVNQGSDYSEAFQFLDGDEAPVDCTGWDAEAVLRLSSTEAFDFTVTAIDASTGQYLVEMDDSVTSGLRSGIFKWQMNLTDGTGIDIRWVEGSATVKKDMR